MMNEHLPLGTQPRPEASHAELRVYEAKRTFQVTSCAIHTNRCFLLGAQRRTLQAETTAWVRLQADPSEFAGDDVIAVAKRGVALNVAEIYRGLPPPV
jgi:hypothetical protein